MDLRVLKLKSGHFSRGMKAVKAAADDFAAVPLEATQVAAETALLLANTPVWGVQALLNRAWRAPVAVKRVMGGIVLVGSVPLAPKLVGAMGLLLVGAGISNVILNRIPLDVEEAVEAAKSRAAAKAESCEGATS